MLLDFFIIGQGIAGSTLAWHLIEKGANIKVIDPSKEHTSSRAAAGLYNPITGRKMVKTWMADQLFPYLEDFYASVQLKSGQAFLHPLPIYRPFISLEEQNDWHAKADNKAFAPFVKQVASKNLYPDAVNDPWGGILLQRCGYLDVPAFLEASQRYFKMQGVYQKAQLNFRQLKVQKDHVQLGNEKAKAIIFCEGPEGVNNPHFQWLPFSPVKGETLTVRPEQPHSVVFNRGIFVLPIGNLSKLGSTYNHQDLTYTTTREARQYLIEKFDKLCKFNYEIIEQRAGVRPATKDRKPFVGMHPEQKTLLIFNGLGTKGVSLAPFFAKQLTEYLLDGQDLEEAVNIKRFYHLYNSVLT